MMPTPAAEAAPLARAAERSRIGRWPLATQRLCLTIALVVTDAVALTLAFSCAYWIRFDLQLTLAPEVIPGDSAYAKLATLLIPVWLLMFVVYNLYDRHARLGGTQESSRIFNACTAAGMLVVVGTFVVPPFVISRMWLIAAWLLSFVFVASSRFAARRVVYGLRVRGYLLPPALIVGTNSEAASLATFLRDQRGSGVRTVGFLEAGRDDGPSPRPSPVLGRVDDIQAIVKAHEIEEVIVAITALNREELLRLCEGLEPLPVQLRISSGLYELLTTRVEVKALGTVPLMSVHKVRLDRAEVIIKTVLDAVITACVLLLVSPVLCAVALAVKIDSRGPVLYRRRVLGVSGRQFDAFKFRTMYVNGHDVLTRHPQAAAELRATHKIKDDPRVTRTGRWLRRFSLDELPQMLNVLLGQMSLVGPRMITAAEAGQYGEQRMNLLTVKPGITGLWQVSGRSDLSYDERVRMDLYYVRNYSVWLDLQILFVHTLPAIIRGRGAY